ncbi:Putative RNA-binding protein regulating sporulation genes [Komagataella phaffii CBS 7435]|uniref:Putative RNA-binding protein regulating sporulation genes n=1 Tax=Komagataella phaffii (strain ATCC 76273 / CBS 7435 / CECT 11047 / NRRL Y-11430 / Wegner 21-1) TaxID=981350 RepID=F2QLY5_KOMPC|nr:GQ67_02360T0 [Komagataella phaffii]AOA66331.1 GQ68_02887T0 [Komagataella phaffii GS115]CAH2445818.1 Putative RNA-binding protein regulating sporulation genes [Komagataella phaffii CBS 7435]CCA36273.1 Putative RNA-binding protein regulating sporulation genes [Komagataella phaffii CBS 7435]
MNTEDVYSPVIADNGSEDLLTTTSKEVVTPGDLGAKLEEIKLEYSENETPSEDDSGSERGSLDATTDPDIDADNQCKDKKLPSNFRGRPSACVFVASLAAEKSDDHLCISVTKHFEQWGKLAIVKVLRDTSNRPYAFVQYTTDDNAKRALKEGQHSILDGRSIRCEPARVNRTLYILTSNDNGLSKVEIINLLKKYGEIEQIVGVDAAGNKAPLSSNSDKRIKEWFVKFVYRDDAIRAYANLRTQVSWHVEWAQNLEPTSTKNQETSTIDKLSIFIGQLSPSITKEELNERFSRHGKIKESVLVQRPNNVFSFIKFEDEQAAASAVEQENHAILKDRTMHVQYREIYHTNNYKRPTSDSPKLSLAPPPVNLSSKNNRSFSRNFSQNQTNRVGQMGTAVSPGGGTVGATTTHGYGYSPLVENHGMFSMRYNNSAAPFSFNKRAGYFRSDKTTSWNDRDEKENGENDNPENQNGKKKRAQSKVQEAPQDSNDTEGRKTSSSTPSSTVRTAVSSNMKESHISSIATAADDKPLGKKWGPHQDNNIRYASPTYVYYVPSDNVYEGGNNYPAVNNAAYYYPQPLQYFPSYDPGLAIAAPMDYNNAGAAAATPYYMYYNPASVPMGVEESNEKFAIPFYSNPSTSNSTKNSNHKYFGNANTNANASTNATVTRN